jgi:hypothetical protein
MHQHLPLESSPQPVPTLLLLYLAQSVPCLAHFTVAHLLAFFI